MRLYRFVLAAFLVFLSLSPSLVLADGFGPFPVRNFQPIQQLVLSMPGDRAAVLKQGVVDFRVELAETASVFNDQNSGATATMKFETLRSGVFLRYGMAERWELSVEVPVLHRSRGFMERAIKVVERATTGLAQVSNPYDACLDDVRKKVYFDIQYMRRQSLAEDIRIMARTIPVMLFRIGGW